MLVSLAGCDDQHNMKSTKFDHIDPTADGSPPAAPLPPGSRTTLVLPLMRRTLALLLPIAGTLGRRLKHGGRFVRQNLWSSVFALFE